MATKRKKSKFREYTKAIIIVVLLTLLIRAFVVEPFKIPSDSMMPTLVFGDHILANKVIFGLDLPFTDSKFLIFQQPRRKDIIVFSFPENKEKEECRSITENIATRVGSVLSNSNPAYLFKDSCRDFIMRVVGVGGDKVEIKDKKAYVNDFPLDEPYKIHKDSRIENTHVTKRDNFGPVTVPRGKFFVMGDNRDESYDSRFWGFVDMEDIKGKAFVIYWSWNSSDVWYNKIRWRRLGDHVL